MKLYNTLTRNTELFKPLQGSSVSLYTCGLTVYSQPHIGNWVAYIYWDILVRTLKDAGYDVTRVQNITDVGHLTSDEDAGEDKMLKGALKEGLTAWQVAEKYIAIADKEAYELLGLLRPDHMPRATEYVPQQIEFVQALEAKGYTYTIADGVYFDTSKLPNYGQLARLDIDGLQFGARVADTGKKNPTDFAVWKFSDPSENRDMEWWAPFVKPDSASDEQCPSGWSRAMDVDAMQEVDEQQTEPYTKYGEGSSAVDAAAVRHEAGSVTGSAGQQAKPIHGSWGFPGWHLECSVMSRELLGDQIDIHTGGIDHIPVHHTNEIAQTEAVTGKQFSTYWVHNNHLKVDGEKMSKSLGNIYTLQDLVTRGYDLMAFKLTILSKHYRTEGNFTWEILDASTNRLQAYRSMADHYWQPQPGSVISESDLLAAKQAIQEALQNDLNTPLALAELSKLEAAIDTGGISTDCQATYSELLEWLDQVLGLGLSGRPDITAEQKKLLDKRRLARQDKDWSNSDKLRDKLAAQNINVKDTPSGQTWHRL